MREPNQVEGEEQRREKSGHTVRQPPSEQQKRQPLALLLASTFPERRARADSTSDNPVGRRLVLESRPANKHFGRRCGKLLRKLRIEQKRAAGAAPGRLPISPSLLLSNIHHNI